ncbi:MAG: FimV/HubP family polar landmark protein [Thiolinea sp.]
MFKHFLLPVLLGWFLSTSLLAAADIYGPISRQDTLWNIAEDLRPSKGVTTQQVMMALYKKNPHAFTVNNISSLRKGAYLLPPTEAETKKIKRKTAVQMVQRHNTRWKKRRFVKVNAPVPKELQEKLAAREAPDEQAATSATDPLASAASVNATTAVGPAKPDEQNAPVQASASASLEQQLRQVQQELAKTKVENQRLNNELAALKKDQANIATQSEANEAIQVQLDALRHELEELRTILTQKDNHIKVLQASLKEASQAIKSQHADNMRLYNKLKELSPESVAAVEQADTEAVNTAGSEQPRVELAEVQTKPLTVAASEAVEHSDSGIAKVWADEVPGHSGNQQAVDAVDVEQQTGSVTLSQILSSQEAAAEPALTQPEKTGFILSTNRSTPVSPIAWAAVLLSFVFILFLIVRALLMQNEIRRLEH